jgi:hypothetical protein
VYATIHQVIADGEFVLVQSEGEFGKPVAYNESGTSWGRLRRERHGVECSAEVGVPAVEVAGELVVEHAGADLP